MNGEDAEGGASDRLELVSRLLPELVMYAFRHAKFEALRCQSIRCSWVVEFHVVMIRENFARDIIERPVTSLCLCL